MGINQSQDRLNMGEYGCWYVENFEPDFKGWNNRQTGAVKRNTTTPINAKVQGIIGLGDCLYFIAGGNFYCMNDTTGVVTMPSGGTSIFDPTAKVRMAINYGKTATAATKIYACDGVSATPRRFNSATNTIASFAISGAWGTFTTPQTVGVWQRRTGFTFTKGSVDESRILFSAEEDGDDYDTTKSSLLDPFDDYVWSGDGDHIVGFGSVQFKGQDAQQDALIVCKSKRSFMATEVVLTGSTRAMTFNNNGVDIGAISPDAIIQFGNDLWVLTPAGIKGFNATLDGSGGVATFASSPVAGIDKLINKASLNDAFSRSFAVHHTNKRKIRVFMPRDEATSASQNGVTYPEVPNDYALCYGYGVLPKWEGNPRGEALWARGGAGFAFSCGCEHKGRLFLGDYFGNIYEMDCEDAGDDNIPVPGETNQPIYGTFQTPFMKCGNTGATFDSKKSITSVTLHGRSNDEVEYDIEATLVIDKAPYEKVLPTISKVTGATGLTNAIYDDGVSLYDASLYAAEDGIPNKITIKPPGWWNALGINNKAVSKRLVNGSYKSNTIWMYAVTGRIERK